MTLLEATVVVVVDFVAVVVHFIVVVNVVVVIVNVIVDVVVVVLFVVTDHIEVKNVNLRLLKAKVEFLWWWGGWVVGFAKSFLCPTQLLC